MSSNCHSVGTGEAVLSAPGPPFGSDSKGIGEPALWPRSASTDWQSIARHGSVVLAVFAFVFVVFTVIFVVVTFLFVGFWVVVSESSVTSPPTCSHRSAQFALAQ